MALPISRPKVQARASTEETQHRIPDGTRRERHAAASGGPGEQRAGNVSTDDDVCHASTHDDDASKCHRDVDARCRGRWGWSESRHESCSGYACIQLGIPNAGWGVLAATERDLPYSVVSQRSTYVSGSGDSNWERNSRLLHRATHYAADADDHGRKSSRKQGK